MSSEERVQEDKSGRKVPRWILFVAGVFAVLVLAGFAAAKLLFPPERLRAMVVPRIEARIGRQVELSAIRLRLLPRVAVRLEDLAIASPPEFGPEPALRMEALDLQLRVLPYLLRREVVLDRLRVRRPEIRYVVLSDGLSNFTGLGPAAAESAEAEGGASGAGLVVSDLRLEEGTIEYLDQRTGRSARLNVDARVSADRDPAEPRGLRSRGAIELSSLRALAPNFGSDTLHLPDLEITYGLLADLAGDSAALQELEVLAGGLPLRGGGALRGLRGDREIDFRMESGEVDIARILGSLPPTLRREDLQASGLARVSVRVFGRLAGGAKPEVDGTIDLQEVAAGLADRGTILTNGSGTIGFDAGALSLPSFKGDLLGRPFTLRMDVSNFSAPKVEGHVTGGVALAQLAELRGQAMPAEGDITFDVDFAGPVREPSALRVTGPIGLREVQYRTEALAVPARIPAATVRLTGTGIAAEGMAIQLGRSDLTLTFNGPGLLAYALSDEQVGSVPAIEFSMRSRLLDAGELLSDTAVGYGALFAARLAGKRIDGRDPREIARERYKVPDLTRLRASGHIEIAELLNPPTRGENLSLDLELAGGVLEAKNLAGRLYDGELGGGLSIDLSDAAGPYPARYDIRLSGARAGAFLERWTRLGQAVTGQLDLLIRGSAPLEEGLLPTAEAIEAAGRATVSEGRLGELPLARMLIDKLKFDAQTLSDFTQLGGGFTIENGAFVLDDWGYAAEDLSATITGSAGLDGRLSLGLNMEVPPSLLQRAGLVESGGPLGDALRALVGEDQAFQLAVGVGGTMANPAVQVDTEALQSELERRLQGEGKDLLRRLIKPPK
ncbi:MAG: AsmA family protein [Gemmatimonadota bacterium]|nr:MAG: AsmA family protein [Gemmatimonadota bacterium]